MKETILYNFKNKIILLKDLFKIHFDKLVGLTKEVQDLVK